MVVHCIQDPQDTQMWNFQMFTWCFWCCFVKILCCFGIIITLPCKTVMVLCDNFHIICYSYHITLLYLPLKVWDIATQYCCCCLAWYNYMLSLYCYSVFICCLGECKTSAASNWKPFSVGFPDFKMAVETIGAPMSFVSYGTTPWGWFTSKENVCSTV